MTKRRNAVQEVMSEQCIYGGLLATRIEVYSDILAITKSHGKTLPSLFVDKLTWMPKKATPEQAEYLSRIGMTLKAIRAAEASACHA